MRALNFFFLRVALALTMAQAGIVSFCNGQGFHFSNHRKKQAVSFIFIKNLVIVPLYINGKGPYNFILDTGVSPMIITDTAIILGLNPQKLRPARISGLGKGAGIDVLLTNETMVKIGKASGEYIPAAILKEDVLGLSNFVGIKISGLLGYYFFKSFIVKINYISKRLIFYLPDYKKKPKGERIPIEIINDKPFVNVQVNVPDIGMFTVKTVVDNGASHAISLETLNGKPFPVSGPSIKANLGIGLNGPVSGSMGRVQALKIGNNTFKNVLASYPVFEDGVIENFLRNRNGNLGADILSRFNITFNYSAGEMYLKRNRNFGLPFEHDMSGMEVYVERTEPERYFISRIEPGSPAEAAGIMVNDEIISINFVNTSALELNDINKLLCSDDGKAVVLSLNRNGELLIKTIKLKKRI